MTGAPRVLVEYLPLIDTVVLLAVVLLVPYWARHRGARVVAILVGLASVLSLSLLLTAPWGRGGCSNSVWTLTTSEIDYSEAGPPLGCRHAEGQAAAALWLEVAAVGAGVLVGAAYGLRLASGDRWPSPGAGAGDRRRDPTTRTRSGWD